MNKLTKATRIINLKAKTRGKNRKLKDFNCKNLANLVADGVASEHDCLLVSWCSLL